MPKFDPNDYPRNGGGGGGNLLPVGKHIVRVVDHELGETNGGLTQVIVTFEARDGRTRKAWLIAEGKAGFQLAMLFDACGWTSAIELDDDRAFRQAFYNKDVEIVVRDEEYEGKTSTKIKWINKAPGGFGGGTTPRREDRRADTRGNDDRRPERNGYSGDRGGYGGGHGGHGGGGWYGAPPREDPAPPYSPDDDIPF